MKVHIRCEIAAKFKIIYQRHRIVAGSINFKIQVKRIVMKTIDDCQYKNVLSTCIKKKKTKIIRYKVRPAEVNVKNKVLNDRKR